MSSGDLNTVNIHLIQCQQLWATEKSTKGRVGRVLGLALIRIYKGGCCCKRVCSWRIQPSHTLTALASPAHQLPTLTYPDQHQSQHPSYTFTFYSFPWPAAVCLLNLILKHLRPNIAKSNFRSFSTPPTGCLWTPARTTMTATASKKSTSIQISGDRKDFQSHIWLEIYLRSLPTAWSTRHESTNRHTTGRLTRCREWKRRCRNMAATTMRMKDTQRRWTLKCPNGMSLTTVQLPRERFMILWAWTLVSLLL